MSITVTLYLFRNGYRAVDVLVMADAVHAVVQAVGLEAVADVSAVVIAVNVTSAMDKEAVIKQFTDNNIMFIIEKVGSKTSGLFPSCLLDSLTSCLL